MCIKTKRDFSYILESSCPSGGPHLTQKKCSLSHTPLRYNTFKKLCSDTHGG